MKGSGGYDKLGKMPKSSGGAMRGKPGSSQHQPHPNGAEVRRADPPSAMVPKQQSTRPITHTPLECPDAKMPKRMGGGHQRDPHRR